MFVGNFVGNQKLKFSIKIEIIQDPPKILQCNFTLSLILFVMVSGMVI
jgi:hypothetical protein